MRGGRGGTVSSGFRRKLHQTGFCRSRLPHLPHRIHDFIRQRPAAELREHSFVLLHARTPEVFCAHSSLHLYVSFRRAPPSRNPPTTSLKPRFRCFRIVLVRLFGTPENIDATFSRFSLFFSLFRDFDGEARYT